MRGCRPGSARAYPRGDLRHKRAIGGYSELRDLAVWLETPQSGGHRIQTRAHFVGDRAEDVRRFDPLGDECRHPSQRGLLLGERCKPRPSWRHHISILL
jgi:hypothetical protein